MFILENTIIHYGEDGKTLATHHGVIIWINRNAGDFIFATRENDRNIEFWCKTDYWTVTTSPKISSIKIQEGVNG